MSGSSRYRILRIVGPFVRKLLTNKADTDHTHTLENDLDDVNLGTLTTNEVLQWDGSEWVNGAVSATVTESSVETALSSSTAFTANNYTFDVDQSVGAGQDDYVLTYDHSSGEIRLEVAPSASGLSDVVDDTSPQLGGTLDANGNIIDMGTNNITDTKVGQWDTAFSWGDHAAAGYLTSFTETNDLTAAVTWANIPDANVPESAVTQHESALSITESQISDLGSYLTSESNDLTSAVTWADIPDANVPQSAVTQHEAALTITESQISDLGSYITGINESDVETALASAAAFTVNNYEFDTDQTVGAGQDNYVLTYDHGSGQIRLEAAGSVSEVNDLTSAVTWADVPDANITESSVTQHEAALSITESQITDLGSYLTDAPSDGNEYVRLNGAWAISTGGGGISDAPSDGNDYVRRNATWQIADYFSGAWGDLTGVPSTFTPSAHTHAASDITSGTFANARISQSSVTQHEGALSIAWSQVTGAPSVPTATDDLTDVFDGILGGNYILCSDVLGTEYRSVPLVSADAGNVLGTGATAPDGVFWDGDYNDLINTPTIITDHGALSGLSDNDHPQYARKASTETISGTWTFTAPVEVSDGTFKLNVGAANSGIVMQDGSSSSWNAIENNGGISIDFKVDGLNSSMSGANTGLRVLTGGGIRLPQLSGGGGTPMVVQLDNDGDLSQGPAIEDGAVASTIVQRNPSGYIYANYYNGTGTFSTTGVTTPPARFTGTNGSDTFGRSYTQLAAAKAINQQMAMIQMRDDASQATTGSDTVLFNVFGIQETYGSGLSYNDANGRITVSVPGIVEISAVISSVTTANNRHQLHVGLQQGNGTTWNIVQRAYSYSRNNQVERATSVINFRTHVSSSDIGTDNQFRLVVRDDGVVGTIGAAAISGESGFGATLHKT